MAQERACEFTYAEPSQETDAALDATLDIIMRHAEGHGYFDSS